MIPSKLSLWGLLTRLTLVLVLAVALSGCTGTKRFFSGMFGKNAPLLPCPRTFVHGDGEKLTKFRPGPGRDLTDVMFEGEINDFRLVCEHEIDDDTRAGTLSLELTVVMVMERGPAVEKREAVYEYFVTLTDTKDEVLQKQLFGASARFEGNVTRFVFTDEPIVLKIPLKAGQSGKDFNIVIGFQLTREELEFNRAQQGLRRR